MYKYTNCATLTLIGINVHKHIGKRKVLAKQDTFLQTFQ